MRYTSRETGVGRRIVAVDTGADYQDLTSADLDLAGFGDLPRGAANPGWSFYKAAKALLNIHLIYIGIINCL